MREIIHTVIGKLASPKLCRHEYEMCRLYSKCFNKSSSQYRLDAGATYFAVVSTDNLGEKVIGMGSYFVHCQPSGHFVATIEDICIHLDYRSKSIGQTLVKDIIKHIKKHTNVYKIVLNCSQELKEFYEGCDFQESAIQMRIDL